MSPFTPENQPIVDVLSRIRKERLDYTPMTEEQLAQVGELLAQRMQGIITEEEYLEAMRGSITPRQVSQETIDPSPANKEQSS